VNNNSILCYSVAVKKRLRAETLAHALQQLILYNEMLQVRLEKRRYIPAPETRTQQGSDLLFICDCTGKSLAEIEAVTGLIIEDLAGEMKCERGATIRAALLNLDKDSDRLLLLLHRAITDSRGLVLILEDLYRIYEQLSNGRKVALRPVGRTYMEFTKGAATAKRTAVADPLSDNRFLRGLSEAVVSLPNGKDVVDQGKSGTFGLTLGNNLRRRLFSWRLAEFGVTPAAALAGALLRGLAKVGRGSSVRLWVKSDYRFTDEALKLTPGALTQTYMLPIDFVEELGLFSDVKKLKGILRDIPLSGESQGLPQLEAPSSRNSIVEHRFRLNLEYLTDDPWLGGDEWLGEGFVVTEKGRLAGNYSIEIIPFILSDGIEISISYIESPGVRALVDELAATLVPELEIILCYCEGYVEAKEFWVGEFGKATMQMKIEIEDDERQIAERGYASLKCQVEKSVVNKALLNVETDESHLLLVAYSALISRLNGDEDLILLCAFDKDGVNTVFPLRLRAEWASSFKHFIGQVQDKLRSAIALGQFAFDILSEEQSRRGWPEPVLDVGYVCQQAAVRKSVERPTGGWLTSPSQLNQLPSLALEVHGRGTDLDHYFVYEKSRFSTGTIERLGACLNAILEEVAANADIKLGEIEFERQQKVCDLTESLAKDAFNF
jgi:Condensation domain